MDLQDPNLDRLSTIASSYQDNDYALLFYSLVRVLKPKLCLEIGVLHGYSALATAMGLRDNGMGALLAFDSNEDRIQICSQHAAHFGLEPYVIFENGALEHMFDQQLWPAPWDWIHIDVNNDGSIYRKAMDDANLSPNGIMLLEGGSPERDELPQMRGRQPMTKAVAEAHSRGYQAITLPAFPSLTLCRPALSAGLASFSRQAGQAGRQAGRS